MWDNYLAKKKKGTARRKLKWTEVFVRCQVLRDEIEVHKMG